jgi:hypothetical protein
MIGTRGFVKRVRKGSGCAGRKCVAIGSARCVAVAPPLPFAVALSPWSGGLFHPPLTIPPVQGLCALYPAGRAFVPSPSHQSRAFRPRTLSRGLAPSTRGRSVPPSPTLTNPARIGCASCRRPG